MPPVACFPVCSTFLALGLVGLVAVLLGWHRSPAGNAPAPPGPDEPAAAGPPFPPWLFVAAPAAVLILTALIGWLGAAW